MSASATSIRSLKQLLSKVEQSSIQDGEARELNTIEAIIIPSIQRDYVQGLEDYNSVRDEFLKKIFSTLESEDGVMDLDFIYGSVEDVEGRQAFLPLDGQQRLTTLFLLHWYLANQEGKWEDFQQWARLQQGGSAFSYRTRPSSRAFFDKLVDAVLSEILNLKTISEWMEDQAWFLRRWKYDPTVKACLQMLDAIHEKVKEIQEKADGCTNFYERLVDEAAPGIQFHLLPMQKFNLGDDLYLKMNARGVPLTRYEIFKSRLLDQLHESRNESIAKEFGEKLDTSWSLFFWKYRNSETSEFDAAVLRVMSLALVFSELEAASSTENKKQELYQEDGKLEERLFKLEEQALRKFIQTFSDLLNFWSAPEVSQWKVHETSILGPSVLKCEVNLGDLLRSDLTYKKALLWYAYFSYLKQKVGFAQAELPIERYRDVLEGQDYADFIRVVRNLLEHRTTVGADTAEKIARTIDALISCEGSFMEHLVRVASGPDEVIQGFNDAQLKEELWKAQLIVAHPDWRSMLEQAERSAFFDGRIGFLLNFTFEGYSKAEFDSHLESPDHREHLDRFRKYLQCAGWMFDGAGIVSRNHDDDNYDKLVLWQRALLACDETRGRGYYNLLIHQGNSLENCRNRLDAEAKKDPAPLNVLWDRLIVQMECDGAFKAGVTKENLNHHLRRIIDDPAPAVSLGVRLLIGEPNFLGFVWRGNTFFHRKNDITLFNKKTYGADFSNPFIYWLAESAKIWSGNNELEGNEFLKTIQRHAKDPDLHLAQNLYPNYKLIVYWRAENDDQAYYVMESSADEAYDTDRKALFDRLIQDHGFKATRRHHSYHRGLNDELSHPAIRFDHADAEASLRTIAKVLAETHSSLS